ncbi:hypothetical protein FJN17_11530 [Bradyrhizobium symbiodeficiens]|uniref:Uncharacterized protein n=1 Tax=Bradyrhizobium symbiodeficiens TaxID=1404367 RepID=A0ABX5W4K3_9BRAD|nr:hypothetical protein [Bradyrhizobium symbiodeficiens]QDF38147.1 hypothetical protein FJN17_11530 [Bradyrhizobium symbiodeficiens]
MTVLTDSQARRGGATASRWYETVDTVSLTATTAIRIKFNIAGNNSGTTEVEVDIGPNDFPTLLETMCIVNRQAAMGAMSVELARQIQTQPERDAKIAKAARLKLGELADQKYYAKPAGDDEHERIVMVGVEALNKEIDDN